MKTFWNVLKNDYYRTIPRLASMVVITIITLASILLAVYMTRIQQVKGHIVLVSPNAQEKLVERSNSLDIIVLKKKPPHSALMEQKYDAYVTIDQNGDYQIETLRNKEFKQMILFLLQNPNAKIQNDSSDRGVGVNIIGYMMMFLLMITLSNLFAFADDKEQGQLVRIATTPASFGWYLAAHCVYCITFLLPEYLILVILKVIGWNIGFTLLEYAGLMLVLGFLGISVGLLLNTLFKKPDNANMLGSAVTVLTSVLAGSFYSFSKNNPVLDNMIKLLPQKELMNFAQNIQNGTGLHHRLSIVYVISFSAVLIVISCILLQQKYVKKV
jgi:ABC-type multidrug transport system, permease component